MPDSLLIGLSALKAQQRAMEVTSHNIANVATPGYSRQRSELAAGIPESTAPGPVGSGVNLSGIRRLSDNLLTEQIRKSSSEEGRLAVTSQALGAVQAIFNEPGEASLTTTVNALYTVLQQLSNNPESPGIRAVAVEQMGTMTELVNGMGERLDGLRRDIGDQLGLEATAINALTRQIAGLNTEIRRQAVTGNAPNDLLDRREQLIADLSNRMDVGVRIDPTTQVAFIQAGGRQIVGGESAVAVQMGSSGGQRSLIFADTGETLAIASGRVGAMLTLHAETLPAMSARLDAFAVNLAAEMNAVHSTGTGADVRVNRFVSGVVIASSQLDVDLDAATQVSQDGRIAGIPEPFLPSFVDANGVSQPRDLTINVRDDATGIATKHIIRYEPGSGPTPAGRSLQDLIDAVNTGSGGGFTLHPAGAGIPALTATALNVDGGVRLELRAAAGHSLDFSRSLDTRPSAEPWNSAWTGAPVDLKGRYTGSLGFDPARPWQMQVVSAGTIGDAAAPPVISVTWYQDVDGSPVARTATTTLGPGHAVGKPVAIGDGVYLTFAGPSLNAGESLNLLVDGAPDQARLLGALGINGIFTGANARTLAVSQELRADPSRLAVGQTRVAGDNSNVLKLIGVRSQRTMAGGASSDEYLATMISDIGLKVDLAERLDASQSAVRAALDNRRDQVAGVSIDEEVGGLIMQQQAYTAAARIITTAQENIRTLLDLIG